MLYTETYTATYDYDVIITEPPLYPSDYTNFVEISTPIVTHPDTYPSDYTNFVEISTPIVTHPDTYPSDYTEYYYAHVVDEVETRIAPYNLGINVSLDTLEISSVVFRRRPHPVHDEHPGGGKGRK